jgi:MATE family multidrug resistance protein
MRFQAPSLPWHWLRSLAAWRQQAWIKELRPVFAMSLPLIVSQAAQMGMLFIDAVLMGRIGPGALASGGLALSSYFFCFVLVNGLCSASGNLVALAYGRGDARAIVAATRAGLFAGLWVAMLIGALLWHAQPVMLALGQSAQTAHQASQFLRVLLWGLPMNMLFLTLRSFASGIGNPGPVPLISLSALLIAPGLGWVLSQGVGSWPGLGLTGIALASVLVYSYMALTFCIVVVKNPHFAHYRLFGRWQAHDLASIKPLLLLGVPTAGTLALESCMFAACAYLMGALGTSALAAHQCMFQLVLASYIIPLGLSQGISMCVGQAAGAGAFQRVKHLGHMGQWLALGWSLLTTGVLLLAPEFLISIFLPQGRPGVEAARQIARSLAPLSAMLLTFDACQSVTNGILRALRDAHATLLIYALGCWGVGIPLAWWLSRHAAGASGVWIGMASGLACVAAMLIWRFNQLSNGLLSGRRAL